MRCAAANAAQSLQDPLPHCGTRMDGSNTVTDWDRLTPLLIDKTEQIQAVVGTIWHNGFCLPVFWETVLRF